MCDKCWCFNFNFFNFSWIQKIFPSFYFLRWFLFKLCLCFSVDLTNNVYLSLNIDIIGETLFWFNSTKYLYIPGTWITLQKFIKNAIIKSHFWLSFNQCDFCCLILWWTDELFLMYEVPTKHNFCPSSFITHSSVSKTLPKDCNYNFGDIYTPTSYPTKGTWRKARFAPS